MSWLLSIAMRKMPRETGPTASGHAPQGQPEPSGTHNWGTASAICSFPEVLEGSLPARRGILS